MDEPIEAGPDLTVADNQAEAPDAPLEQGQGAPEVDFAERFDPNSLDENLQEQYRSMRGDYTRKTQELAEARKAFEAEQQAFAEQQQFLDAITQDPGLLQQIQAYFAGEDNPEPDEFADPFEAKLSELEQRQAAIEQREQQQQMQALTEQALTADLEEVTKLNGGNELTQEELDLLGHFVRPDQHGIPRIDVQAWQKQNQLFEARRQSWINGKTQAPAPPGTGGQGSRKFDFNNEEERLRAMEAVIESRLNS